MNSNTANQTVIPVTIETGLQNEGDELAITRQRIGKAALHVDSLLNMIRTTAEVCRESLREAAGSLAQPLEDINSACELAKALTDSIYDASNELPSLKPSAEPETPETGDVADQLSRLLRNPSLPAAVRTGFLNVISDEAKDEASEKIAELETSPGYLKVALFGER